MGGKQPLGGDGIYMRTLFEGGRHGSEKSYYVSLSFVTFKTNLTVTSRHKPQGYRANKFLLVLICYNKLQIIQETTAELDASNYFLPFLRHRSSCQIRMPSRRSPSTVFDVEDGLKGREATRGWSGEALPPSASGPSRVLLGRARGGRAGMPAMSSAFALLDSRTWPAMRSTRRARPHRLTSPCSRLQHTAPTDDSPGGT